MNDFSQTDIYTDVSLVDDPWPYFEYLREQGPITRLPHRNVLAVTGFEEALAIYADPASFSSVNSVTGPIPDLPFTPQGDDIAQLVADHRPNIPFGQEVSGLDAPLHGPMRSLLMPLFTPGRLKAMDAGFRQVAEELISRFPTTGEVEFIGDYANPLATLIITELLGIPHEDRPIFLAAFRRHPGRDRCDRRGNRFQSADRNGHAHRRLHRCPPGGAARRSADPARPRALS